MCVRFASCCSWISHGPSSSGVTVLRGPLSLLASSGRIAKQRSAGLRAGRYSVILPDPYGAMPTAREGDGATGDVGRWPERSAALRVPLQLQRIPGTPLLLWILCSSEPGWHGGGDSGDTGTAEVPVRAGRGGRARKYRRSTRPPHPFSRSFARCASQHPFLSTVHPPRPPAEWLMHGLFPISGWDSERPSQRPRPRRLPRRTLLRLAASGVVAGRGLARRASSSGVAEPTTVRRRGLSWIPGCWAPITRIQSPGYAQTTAVCLDGASCARRGNRPILCPGYCHGSTTAGVLSSGDGFVVPPRTAKALRKSLDPAILSFPGASTRASYRPQTPHSRRPSTLQFQGSSATVNVLAWCCSSTRAGPGSVLYLVSGQRIAQLRCAAS